jgi:hypothetical protein
MKKISLAILVCYATCAAQQNVEVQQKEKHIEVTIGGKPFTTYYFDPVVAKPYLMPLRSAQGTIVSRGYPVVNEVPPGSERDKSFEPHQRPLYFGHGNVDSVRSAEVLALLRKLNREHGQTFVLVTHDLEVGEACDRIVRMRDGLLRDSER